MDAVDITILTLQFMDSVTRIFKALAFRITETFYSCLERSSKKTNGLGRIVIRAVSLMTAKKRVQDIIK